MARRWQDKKLEDQQIDRGPQVDRFRLVLPRYGAGNRQNTLRTQPDRAVAPGQSSDRFVQRVVRAAPRGAGSIAD